MLHIALLGFGVVGSGVAEVITKNQDVILSHLGEAIDIKYILDLREFPDSPFADKIVHDFNMILQDPEVTVVAEMMGGAHPAYDFSLAALQAGKSVVTSNKQVVASFGAELTALARQKGVRYLFEASVGGGIPVLRTLMTDYGANTILSIDGILNGTTNYMLTRMKKENISFDAVLREAQSLGYAERDPSADVEGPDAARKIAILAGLAFGILPDPDAIHTEGITRITGADVASAAAFGYAVKLIGHAEKTPDGKVLAMVCPRLVPDDNPLSHVEDVFNGILVKSDMLGDTMFYGRGAGKLPTAGAVVSDILDIARHPGEGCRTPLCQAGADRLASFSDYTCRRMLVFETAPGDTAENAATSLTGIRQAFGQPEQLSVENDERISLITPPISECDIPDYIYRTGLNLQSHLRLLD